MLIKIAICDDEIGTCSDIENMILNYAELQALQIDTKVFYSGETLFKALENKDKYIRLNHLMKNDFLFHIGKSTHRLYLDEIFYFSYVSIYHYDAVQMTDGTILPISQKYRKHIKSCLTELYRNG